MNKNKLIVAACTLLCNITLGQQAKENYALIQPGDTERDIINKAANVTPSPRQLRWQQHFYR